MVLPLLVFQYKKYCDCVENFIKTGAIDLRRETWVPPTFSLPLALLIMNNLEAPRRLPVNEDAASYLTMILSTKVEDRKSKSYIPLARLPANVADVGTVLQSVYEIQKDDLSAFGGDMAFKYVVSELVDNIYEHSKFKIAFVMAQRYPKLRYIELAFIDDGITIQGSYKEHGKNFKSWQAIIEALNGLSTKSAERGWGLRTSIRIFREGLKGQILIVSGEGAVYLDKSTTAQYRLTKNQRMRGTMISVRVPYPSQNVDIYKYIQ